MILHLTNDELMELIQSETFQNQVKEADGHEGTQKLLMKHGIEMDEEELNFLLRFAESKQVSELGKLSEEDMENIVGGFGFDDVKRIASQTWDVVCDVAGQTKTALTSDEAKSVYRALLSIL